MSKVRMLPKGFANPPTDNRYKDPKKMKLRYAEAYLMNFIMENPDQEFFFNNGVLNVVTPDATEVQTTEVRSPYRVGETYPKIGDVKYIQRFKHYGHFDRHHSSDRSLGNVMRISPHNKIDTFRMWCHGLISSMPTDHIFDALVEKVDDLGDPRNFKHRTNIFHYSDHSYYKLSSAVITEWESYWKERVQTVLQQEDQARSESPLAVVMSLGTSRYNRDRFGLPHPVALVRVLKRSDKRAYIEVIDGAPKNLGIGDIEGTRNNLYCSPEQIAYEGITLEGYTALFNTYKEYRGDLGAIYKSSDDEIAAFIATVQERRDQRKQQKIAELADVLREKGLALFEREE